MMKRILSVAMLAIISCTAFAQKKELTLSESVLQQYRAFRPDQLTGFSWIPKSDNYVYAESYTTMKRSSAKKNTPENWFTIQEVNTALGAKLFSFYGYTWKNDQELYVNNGQQFYVYNPTTKKGKTIADLGEDAENATLEPTTGHVAYTQANNLYIQGASGEKIVVTSNENKGIVSGQTIARNEFGIAGGIFWSPQGNHLAFYQKDESGVHEYPLVNIMDTPGSMMPIRYPMAGQTSEKPKVGIFHLATKQTVFITPKGAADDYVTNLAWTPDEKYIIIAEVNRDQNHMWLNMYDAKSGVFVRTLLEETSDKWVEPEHPVFFPSAASNNFVWISEKDGFNNLYYYSIDGKLIRQLTTNKFVAKEILQSTKAGQEIVFSATGTSPLNTLYYVVDLNGKQRCLTLEEGTHAIYLNESGTFFLDEYSSHTVPSKSVLKTISGKVVKNLLTSADKLADYKIGTADIGQIKAGDGSVLYTRLIKPSNFDPEKKYPVLVYVYGGPHAQMITNSWLDGASLWMYWMAEQGYLVFTLDNRGSGERGFAFESQVHRQLGTIEIEDQMKGVDFLKSLPYVDSSRLAVHGWSFGGFMTTSLMLRQAGTFNVGVAGGPVTDWKYYEVMYGERYMDRPEQNQKGYEQSSLMTHAANLKGDLLLIHGTVDDVVVMQHNLALVKKFVDLGIQMDFFPYPMHKHNVTGKDRVHLMEKVLKYVIEHN
jgi:dipeptidyl-peptidase 4